MKLSRLRRAVKRLIKANIAVSHRDEYVEDQRPGVDAELIAAQAHYADALAAAERQMGRLKGVAGDPTGVE